jgi:hypothetical protein
LLHLGQIAHHRAAQANQKARKDEGNKPQAALKPFFRQAKGFTHGFLSLSNQ